MIATTITGVQVLNKRQGTLTVSLSALGKWVYRILIVNGTGMYYT
jgi:hypothetical protein